MMVAAPLGERSVGVDVFPRLTGQNVVIQSQVHWNEARLDYECQADDRGDDRLAGTDLCSIRALHGSASPRGELMGLSIAPGGKKENPPRTFPPRRPARPTFARGQAGGLWTPTMPA
jgi:hypothetical protein